MSLFLGMDAIVLNYPSHKNTEKRARGYARQDASARVKWTLPSKNQEAPFAVPQNGSSH
jgi:hypothetical protein